MIDSNTLIAVIFEYLNPIRSYDLQTKVFLHRLYYRLYNKIVPHGLYIFIVYHIEIYLKFIVQKLKCEPQCFEYSFKCVSQQGEV